MIQAWWFWALIAYLCGSIPFALLIARAKGIDIRTVGSGNVGATNVGRALGRKWGILCFMLDALKGLVPVLAAGWAMGWLDPTPTGGGAWRWMVIGAFAVLGHVFPVWLGFKGGKGVATSLGVLLGMWPVLTLPGVAAGLTWLIVVKLTRYVSLTSIIASTILPVYLAVATLIAGRSLGERLPYLIVTSLMALLLLVRHRPNIQRLLAGTESKVGQKRG